MCCLWRRLLNNTHTHSHVMAVSTARSNDQLEVAMETPSVSVKKEIRLTPLKNVTWIFNDVLYMSWKSRWVQLNSYTSLDMKPRVSREMKGCVGRTCQIRASTCKQNTHTNTDGCPVCLISCIELFSLRRGLQNAPGIITRCGAFRNSQISFCLC